MEKRPTNNTPVNTVQTDVTENGNWSAIDVRSAEVQEIIGRPPHGLVRWGITAFFGVLALVLLSAWVIEYPEVIKTPLRLTAIHAPKTLESKINGKLVKLTYGNNTDVRQGQVLAWLESTASHRQVLALSAKTDSMRRWLRRDNFQQIKNAQLAGFSDLGGLQTNFQSFEQSRREFISFLEGGYYRKKRRMLEEEMQYTHLLLKELMEQKRIQEKNFNLARQKYDMQKKLAEKNLLAPMELAQQESELLASRLPLQQSKSAIINNYLSQQAKEKEILELDRQMAEQQSVFLQAINTLKSTIDEWKSNYLLTAPFPGRLTYAGILQENQTLMAGQEVLYIQPDNTDFFGELVVSQSSLGKIREGQEVLVRFSSYPYQEFGSVTGKLDYLSEFPVRDSVFLGKVSLPQRLVTNYGRKLTPRNGMAGQAEIITQDLTLLERVINNMTKELR